VDGGAETGVRNPGLQPARSHDEQREGLSETAGAELARGQAQFGQRGLCTSHLCRLQGFRKGCIDFKLDTILGFSEILKL
jgi:hypothetical protein